MKIGYGAMSGAIYLILGPSELYPEDKTKAKTLRLDDGYKGKNTSLVDVRDFTIKDLLITNPYYLKHKKYLLQAIKELVQ